MKKIIILAIFAIAALNLNAKNDPTPDYITTEQGTFFYPNVKYGLTDFLVAKTSAGIKVKFNADEVKSYKLNGKVYERKNLIKDGEECSKCGFMQIITYRHGIYLYKQDEVNFNGRIGASYHLFKNGEYIMSVNESNYDYVMDFLNSRSTQE